MRPYYENFAKRYTKRLQGFKNVMISSNGGACHRKSYIQYQLWTTQTEKLPQERLDNNWLWDNIGGNFEEYEMQSDFGEYRVMRRELPTEYAITAIVTGYHKDGKWIWRNYFRPIYEF